MTLAAATPPRRVILPVGYITGEPLKYDVSCDFQFESSVASDLSAYKRISWVHAAHRAYMKQKLLFGFAFDTQDLMNFL
jgi:hypothetical protein